METFFLGQMVQAPTRITDTSSTLLDHLWSNCEERVVECSVENGFSDHKLISGKVNIKISHTPMKDFMCRSYKGFNKDGYLSDLATLDWSFLGGDDIESIWRCWKENVLSTLNKHTRMIKIKQSNS